MVVARSVDLQRGLDYLAGRPEIDMDQLTALGTSIYSHELIPFAVETRYRAIVLLSAGVPASEARAIPEANAIHFAPRISAPTLLINGRYDETLSIARDVEPLFFLFRQPKRLELLDGGHIPPLDAWVPMAREWLARAGTPAGGYLGVDSRHQDW
jgi:pimeloyl-ACP methyl ester carboxylesterase